MNVETSLKKTYRGRQATDAAADNGNFNPLTGHLVALKARRKKAIVPLITRKGDVRFGSEADICNATAHVRFTPNSDRESGLPQTVMSVLPPRADISCRQSNVS
jgi:hypothetical protein